VILVIRSSVCCVNVIAEIDGDVISVLCIEIPHDTCIEEMRVGT